MSGRRGRTVIVLVAAAFVLGATTSARARRVTLTRAAIAEADATRLSDLLARVGIWSAQSTDGYTWQPTPNALALPRANTWTVLLNNHVLDVSVFDANHLELVPAGLAEIDSIVIDDMAEAGRGWDAGRGRIAIFASPTPRGWSFGGAVSAGNETGDPGPYRYTPLASPNVDAIGPDGSLFVSLGRGTWYAGLSASLMQHPFSDEAMRARTTAALVPLPGTTPPEQSSLTSWFYDAQWPAVLRTSAALRAGLRAGGGWQRALLSISDGRRYFHYSEPFGSEVPTDQRLVLAGVSGGFAEAGRTRVSYRAQVQEKTLEDRDGTLSFDYDWANTRALADADLTHDLPGARVNVTAGVERREVDTADTLTRSRDTFTRAGLAVASRSAGPLAAAGDVEGTFAGGEDALAASGRVHWVVRDADTLSVRASFQERLFAEDDNLWLWSERGYALLAAQGVSYTIDGAIGRTAVTAGDLRWSSSGVLGAIAVSAGARRFHDAYVEERDFTFDPATCTFRSPTHVATGLTGHVSVLDLRLWHRLGDTSRGDFSFVYLEEFESDDAFSRVWQSVPRHRISYAMTFHPRPTWTLRGRVTHWSATTWTDYAGVDGAVCEVGGAEVTYRARVDGATVFDLFVQHSLWNRAAMIDLGARNLFDADVRYHPAGAANSFTVYLQLRLLKRA